MEGATLTINFRDDAAGVPQSPAATPQQGTLPQSSLVQDQQQAITAAGGVAAQVTKAGGWVPASTSQPATISVAAPAPIHVGELPPAITTATSPPPLTGESAVARTVQQIAANDPRATAEEIAKLLGGGLTAKQVQGMMNGPTVSPPSAPPQMSPVVSAPAKSTTDDLVESTKKLWQTDLVASTKDMWEQEAVQRQRDYDAGASERRKPPAPPTAAPPVIRTPDDTDAVIRATRAADERTASGVQAAMGQITALASQFGRVPGAIAGAATAYTAMPGVATALGSAAPALITAAPYIAAATALAAVPMAAISNLQGVADMARGQIVGLSPAASLAEAQADVRRLLANVRTAGVLGDEVAANVTARSNISASIQGLRDALVEGPLRDLNNNLNIIAQVTSMADKAVSGGNAETRNAFTSSAFAALLSAAVPGFGNLWGVGSGVGAAVGPPEGPKFTGLSAGLYGDSMVDLPEHPELPWPFGGEDAPGGKPPSKPGL